jgi:hypothetical protein
MKVTFHLSVANESFDKMLESAKRAMTAHVAESGVVVEGPIVPDVTHVTRYAPYGTHTPLWHGNVDFAVEV